MSRRIVKPVNLRAASMALAAVAAFGLAAVLTTADLTTGSGDNTTLAPGSSTRDPAQEWVGSSPAAHGLGTLDAPPQAVIPPFADPVTFPVGLSPTGIATGDFNHDSNQDVATSNALSDDVAVLPGAGDGSLGTAAFFGAGIEPSAVTTGFFDADADLDIATANGTSNDVSVLLGNGDGTFSPAVFYGVGDLPFAIVSADYNEDGIVDLATANAFTDDVSILLGKGDGTFFDEIYFTAGFIPFGLTHGDYDGDGHLDLAVVNFGDESVSILPGQGDGTFGADTGPYPIGTDTQPVSIATSDFNGDTILDLVTVNLGTDDVGVLLGNGDATFQDVVLHGVGVAPLSVAVADFDRNGTMDLATADAATITILSGNGDGTFMMALMLDVDLEPFVVFATDLNADDSPDIIVANSVDDSISVLINLFTPSNSPPVADAGDDRNVECGSAEGTPVTLDGSGSTDPDGDTLTYVWTGPFSEGGGTVEGVAPVVTLPAGMSQITLVVSDGTIDSEPDSVTITVADTTPPTLTGSFALSGNFQGWGKGGHGGGHDDDGHIHGKEVLLVEFAAVDACDPSPSVTGTYLVGTCQSLAATSGDLIEFKQKKHCKAAKCKHGVLRLAGPSLTLRITGSDASGNQSTPLDVPYLPAGCNDLSGDTSGAYLEPQRPASTRVPTPVTGER